VVKPKKGVRKSGRGRGRTASARLPAAHDAIALLKADHHQVREWFEQFQSARSSARKQVLAGQICQVSANRRSGGGVARLARRD
jgi:hypothetical protein